MNELIEHLQAQKFAELKDRLKQCTSQAEQRRILAALKPKELDQFTAWLLADGNAVATLHMIATGVAQRR
jgi:hypothetical protein